VVALGFTAAMKLRWNAWMPLLDKKGIECGLLLPIMIYCADELELPADPLRNGLFAKSYLRAAHHDIPMGVPAIRYPSGVGRGGLTHRLLGAEGWWGRPCAF
jgi:uncharacterized protein